MTDGTRPSPDPPRGDAADARADGGAPPDAAPRPAGRVVPADPVLAEPEAPPLHRVASLALVSAALAGPLGSVVLAACFQASRFGRIDLEFLLVGAAVMGACAAFLAAVAAVARRVRRARRLLALGGAALSVTFLGTAVAAWFTGFARGGHEEAWAELLDKTSRLVTDAYSRSVIASTLPPFLLLGGLSAGVVPGLARPTRLVWSAIAGAAGGALFVCVIWFGRGRVDSEWLRILGSFSITGAALGVGLNLAERLEPRLAAALRRRVVGD